MTQDNTPSLESAFEIVLDLAEQNVMLEEYCDGDEEMLAQREEQIAAVKIVTDYTNKHIWGQR